LVNVYYATFLTFATLKIHVLAFRVITPISFRDIYGQHFVPENWGQYFVLKHCNGVLRTPLPAFLLGTLFNDALHK
jgi:hypothetical protein